MKIPNLIHAPLIDSGQADNSISARSQSRGKTALGEFEQKYEFGKMNAGWQNFFTQLVQQLQANVGENGFSIPQQSTTNIAAMQVAGNQTGLLVYDNMTHELKVNINGTFKTVQVV